MEAAEMKEKALNHLRSLGRKLAMTDRTPNQDPRALRSARDFLDGVKVAYINLGLLHYVEASSAVCEGYDSVRK